MADDDQRAEIEAVAEALKGPLPDHAASFYAPRVIAALDRVRDARGDDEVVNTDIAVAQIQRAQAEAAARSPQGEGHETTRPEQPAPDALGGQPPAEPETP